ncbi:MAG: stage III sporulation protein AF [Clostridiaceae bacterium]
MIVFIKQWVMNIVTLVLFIIMFEMILPTGKMKKYIRLVTSTIMVIVIIDPLVGLLDRNFDFTAVQTVNSNMLDRLQVEKDSKVLEDEQMEQIVEVYRNNIIEQMELEAEEIEGVNKAKADIIFNEDYNSKAFGEIKRAYLEIETSEASPAAQSEGIAGTVDPVSIEPVAAVEHVKIEQSAKPIQSDDYCDPQIIRMLEEKIGQVFGVKSENIIISQMKR